MSLDERLRSGLQTMVEPAGDAERALTAFREHAYPRRARRRVLEAVAGGLAAAAIVAGATTAVVNSAEKRPGFITHIPSDAPACREADVQSVTGAGDADSFSLSVFSTKGACKIDETFVPFVTSNALRFVSLEPVHLLEIRGNNVPIGLTGIVPAESSNAMLTISWTWTNWCGPDRSFTLSFHRISGQTEVLKDAFASSGTFASVPACIDPSKPSIMLASPAALTTRESSSSSPTGPLYDQHPHIIAPRSGLTNLVRSPVDQVLVRPDDKTLIVSFTHGVGCREFARIDVSQDANGVTISPYVGDVPESACVGQMVYGDAAVIVLKQPLGNRQIYDGSYPGNLGVRVYHVKS